MTARSAASSTEVLIAVVLVAAVATGIFLVLRMKSTGQAGSGLGKEFQYDTSDLRRFDPKLVKYEQVGRIETGFAAVRGIAAGPDDRIYVAGDTAIHVFDRDGKMLPEIRTAGQARCLCVAKDGTLYAGMEDHVEVLAPGAAGWKAWASPAERALLTAVAVSADSVFVADVGGRIIHRFDRTGKLLKQIGPTDETGKATRFSSPIGSVIFDLAVAPDGLLRVAHTGRRLVEAYTFDGDREFAWGRSGTGIEEFSGCCNPAHLAVLPDGRIVTSEKGALWAVKVYHPDGPDLPDGKLESVVVAGRKPTPQGAGRDVAVDSRQRILVLEPEDRTVRIFARKEPI